VGALSGTNDERTISLTSASDKTGNNSSGLTTYDKTITLDSQAPTISGVTINGGDPYADDTADATLEVTFSEATSGLESITLAASPGFVPDDDQSATIGSTNYTFEYTNETIVFGATRPTGTGATITIPGTLTGGAGNNTVTLTEVKDAAGHDVTGLTVTDDIFLDLTAPTISSVTINTGGPYATTTAASITVTFTEPAGESGLASITLAASPGFTPSGTATTEGNNYTFSYAGNVITFTGTDANDRPRAPVTSITIAGTLADNSGTDGDRIVTITGVADAAGHTTGSVPGSPATITLDRGIPTISGVTINGGATYATDTAGATLNVTFSEAGTGLASITLGSLGFIPSANGTTSGGGTYDFEYASNIIEFTGATAALRPTGTATITIPGTLDDTSGDGTKTVTISSAADAAGNSATISNGSDTITLDTTPPAVTADGYTGAAALVLSSGSNYYIKRSGSDPVKAKWTVSDATSGVTAYNIVAQTSATAPATPAAASVATLASDGAIEVDMTGFLNTTDFQYVFIAVKDDAGNVSAYTPVVATDAVKLDETPPTIAATVATTSGLAGGTTYGTNPVYVNEATKADLAGTDDVSGIGKYLIKVSATPLSGSPLSSDAGWALWTGDDQYAITGLPEGTAQYVYVALMDNAENISAYTQVGGTGATYMINLDNTAPAFGGTLSLTGAYSGAAQITGITITDGGSALQSASLTGTTSDLVSPAFGSPSLSVSGGAAEIIDITNISQLAAVDNYVTFKLTASDNVGNPTERYFQIKRTDSTYNDLADFTVNGPSTTALQSMPFSPFLSFGSPRSLVTVLGNSGAAGAAGGTFLAPVVVVRTPPAAGSNALAYGSNPRQALAASSAAALPSGASQAAASLTDTEAIALRIVARNVPGADIPAAASRAPAGSSAAEPQQTSAAAPQTTALAEPEPDAGFVRPDTAEDPEASPVTTPLRRPLPKNPAPRSSMPEMPFLVPKTLSADDQKNEPETEDDSAETP
jgi:hypothetical protein